MPQTAFSDRLRFITFMLGIFVTLTVFGYLTDHSRKPKSGPFPISVDPVTLDFGEVHLQQSFPWTLTVKNTSDSFVHLKDLQSSCACTSVSPKSAVLRPNETVDLHLKLDLTTAVKDGRRGKFSAQLLPIIRGGGTPSAPWNLTGTVINWLDVIPAIISYTDLQPHGMTLPPKTISVHAIKPLAKLDARIVPPTCGTTSVRPIGDNGRDFEVTLKPTEGIPLGPLDFACVLNAETYDGLEIPERRMNVYGEVARPVVAYPPVIRAGHVFLDEPFTRDFSLESLNGSRFDVTGMDYDADVLEIRSLTPTKSRYRVKVSPANVGPYSTKITLDIALPNGEGENLEIPVKFTGFDKSRTKYCPIPGLE